MKKSTTAKAFVMSVLALVLCLSMLVGTTFAWFTDSVTSGVNKIVAGNLDVELFHSNGKVTDEKVGAETKLFVGKDGEPILWEPGVIVYENFTVKNAGTLALKYKLALNVSGFNTIDEKSLKDVLKVAILDEAFSGTREEALALNYAYTIEDFSREGTIAAGGADKTHAIVIYWKPTANDNDYNLNNGKVSTDNRPLFIDLGIKLVAGQTPEENDSFGKDYDQNAEYPVIESATDWYDNNKDATSFTIKNGYELAYIAKLVNSGTETFKDKTITLANDIVLPAGEWKAIGTYEKRFKGTFDGNGHTVSNVTIHDNDGNQPCGFFGAVEGATIQNLKVSGTMTLDALQEHESVGGDYAEYFGNSGICGFAVNSTISKCVNAINIDATHRGGSETGESPLTLGGILGCSQGSTVVENCLNIGSITVPTTGTAYIAGGITPMVGQLNSATYATIKNCVNAGENNGTTDLENGPGVSGSIVAFANPDAVVNCYSVKGETTIGANMELQPSQEGFVENATSLDAFAGLDPDIWEMGPDGYPVLK